MAWHQIEGWFDFDDIYRDFAVSARPGAVFVEVGVFLGRSLAYMLEQTRGKDVSIYAVDPWADEWYGTAAAGGWGGEHAATVRSRGAGPFEAFCTTMRAFAPGDFERARVMRLPSVQAARAFEDGSIDLGFLDGDHRLPGIRADIAAWLPKIRPGGILAGHDCTPTYPDVEQAVRERFGSNYEVRRTSWIHRV